VRKLRRNIAWIVRILSAAVAVAAVAEQMRLPAEERTWNGRIYGVPYDFRAPSLHRAAMSWWNPEDKALFTPQPFGIGWVINLHRLLELASAGLAKLGR
jgi:hypothetical protein